MSSSIFEIAWTQFDLIRRDSNFTNIVVNNTSKDDNDYYAPECHDLAYAPECYAPECYDLAPECHDLAPECHELSHAPEWRSMDSTKIRCDTMYNNGRIGGTLAQTRSFNSNSDVHDLVKFVNRRAGGTRARPDPLLAIAEELGPLAKMIAKVSVEMSESAVGTLLIILRKKELSRLRCRLGFLVIVVSFVSQKLSLKLSLKDVEVWLGVSHKEVSRAYKHVIKPFSDNFCMKPLTVSDYLGWVYNSVHPTSLTNEDKVGIESRCKILESCELTGHPFIQACAAYISYCKDHDLDVSSIAHPAISMEEANRKHNTVLLNKCIQKINAVLHSE